MQMLAGLKPAFVHFPGGAIVGGMNLDNRIQWKNSVGDISQRKGTMNLWGYYTTNGLGYHEYLQMCEDLKADAAIDALGAELVTLDARKAREYGIGGGVLVKKINEGALNDQTRMKDGFVIIKVNDRSVKSIDDLRAALGNEKEVTISGFYPGYDAIYEYPITLGDE